MNYLTNRGLTVLVIILLSISSFSSSAQKIEPVVLMEFHTGTPIGGMRAIPIALSPDEDAILISYSESSFTDPYEEMFFFPGNTLKFVLIDLNGNELWRKDLGRGVIPGNWFTPVYTFDLDNDGTDEIYFVNNTNPDHPFSRARVLEQLDARTGETLNQIPWKFLGYNMSLSHRFRYFISGGIVDRQPVLVTATGTYSDMNLQCWNSDFSLRWELDIPADKEGSRGSHMMPVVDIDGDGNDEIMVGERCINLDTGEYKFIADQGKWWGHSDLVQPVWNYDEGKWYIMTNRETGGFSPRIILFNNKGERVWSDLDEGHMDMGWCANLGPNGESVTMSIKILGKTAGPDGVSRTNYSEHVYETFTGKKINPPYPVFSTLPVDLNGDGIHELVRARGNQGCGNIYDNKGNILGNVGDEGIVEMVSKFLDLPGEQILVYYPDGTIKVFGDRNAKDSPRALKRYSSPFYQKNMKLVGQSNTLKPVLGGL